MALTHLFNEGHSLSPGWKKSRLMNPSYFVCNCTISLCSQYNVSFQSIIFCLWQINKLLALWVMLRLILWSRREVYIEEDLVRYIHRSTSSSWKVLWLHIWNTDMKLKMNLLLTIALFGTLAWALPIGQETERISKKDRELAEVMVDSSS